MNQTSARNRDNEKSKRITYGLRLSFIERNQYNLIFTYFHGIRVDEIIIYQT